MFCLDRKIPIKKPSIWSARHAPCVGFRVEKVAYHMEIGEALALANRLVDAVELIEAREKEKE